MINEVIAAVGATRIAVGLMKNDADREHLYQMVSYSNEMKLDPNYPSNAMILPVPGENIQISTMDSTVDFMTPIMNKWKQAFHNQRPMKLSRGMKSKGKSSDDDDCAAHLEVKYAGSWTYCVAASVRDLIRFDPQVFTLSQAAQKFIETKYPSNHSFIILKFNTSGVFHPFTYWYPLLQPTSIFIPTMHFHTGEDNETGDFDPEIYLFGYAAHDVSIQKEYEMLNFPAYDDEAGDQVVSNPQSYYEKINNYISRFNGSGNMWCCGNGIYQLFLKGNHKNRDLVINTIQTDLTHPLSHKGRICDICATTDFQGQRFVCLFCSELDVCKKCFHQDKHAKYSNFKNGNHLKNHDPDVHSLIEIRTPFQILARYT